MTTENKNAAPLPADGCLHEERANGAPPLPGAGELLRGNSYPGRGILIGMTGDGKHAVCAYFIMGRSANSRNRVLRFEDGRLFTAPYDERKVADPSLIIYTALRPCGDRLIVSNGDQTDTVARFLGAGGTFREALETRSFEPDAPNFTPRISGLLSFEGGFSYEMSILKSADPAGGACARAFFSYKGTPGRGRLLHTYERNGDPLPSFEGAPRMVSIGSDIDELADELWNALDGENKIALYLRFTDPASGGFTDRLINKYT